MWISEDCRGPTRRGKDFSLDAGSLGNFGDALGLGEVTQCNGHVALEKRNGPEGASSKPFQIN
jgi:hypothetical protein